MIALTSIGAALSYCHHVTASRSQLPSGPGDFGQVAAALSRG
jgi:hypothetical protein